MDYKTISDKIKTCKNELDLLEVRELIDKFRVFSDDATEYSILLLMLATIRKKIEKNMRLTGNDYKYV